MVRIVSAGDFKQQPTKEDQLLALDILGNISSENLTTIYLNEVSLFSHCPDISS
jgi:hypothetical protein